MTDAPSTDAPTTDASTPGAILRAAREKQGLHIAVLAASIKVAKGKLEALENDRYDQLPDMTFTRALAKTVCRALKLDPEPVLAKLPHAASYRLEPIGSGLNEPFRERGGHREPPDWSFVKKPFFWAVVAMLLAAAVLYLLPDEWLRGFGAAAPIATATPASSAAASAPVAQMSASAPVEVAPATSAPVSAIETVHSAPPAAAAQVPVAAGIAVLRASDESWVEVTDGNGQVLVSRTLLASEEVGLNGVLPLRVKIGNAAATTLTFRGQPIDLARSMRDNVARLELK